MWRHRRGTHLWLAALHFCLAAAHFLLFLLRKECLSIWVFLFPSAGSWVPRGWAVCACHLPDLCIPGWHMAGTNRVLSMELISEHLMDIQSTPKAPLGSVISGSLLLNLLSLFFFTVFVFFFLRDHTISKRRYYSWAMGRSWRTGMTKKPSEGMLSV